MLLKAQPTDSKADSGARILLTRRTIRSTGVRGGFGLQDHLESLVLRMREGGIRYSEALREFQKIFVLTVLREQEWNQVRAAETLDVHRDTLRRLIHQFHLDIRSLRTTRRRPPESERPLPLEKEEQMT